MPANFPANPTTNQVYVYNGTSWVWTGSRWQVQLGTVLIGATGPTGATGASANLLNITSNVIPSSHETYDLGANAQRWRDLYLSGNSFYLGNTILRSTGNTLQLPAGSTIGGIPVADTGQVTQIASTASPKISNVKVTDNTWTILDDTAIDTAGGYIIINGAGYVSVPQVYINNTAATSVSFVNSTQLRVQVPAFAAGTYPLYVINSDGGTGILVPGISFSGFPAWASPAAGNVGLNYETDAITSLSLSASSNSAVTYVLASGSLPPGVTLTGSTISGTTQATATNTTYNFTIEARDAENQSTLRAFSITVNTDVVSWSTPANAAVISGYEYGSVTQSLAATSAAGKAITYSGSNLPGNIVVTGSTVAGNLGAATNATTASNTASTLTATAATTNRTASRTLFFVANPDQVTWSSPTSNGVITGYEFSNLSATLSAVSAAGRTVAYSSSDLPANITITGATVSGLLAAVGNTSSNLTATAATTNRANTLPVTIQTIPDVVTWSTPTSGQTITIQATDAVNQALAATSAAGKAITYSANNLPTGLSVVGSAVTGTPSGYTSSTTVSSNLTATAATTNRSSTISITWSINLAISFATDPFFANVSLLLNAAANASVISDASSNNFQLTPVGDVRASTFSPYLGGNYSVLFNNATPDNLIVATDAGTSLTGDFTIESWIYMTAAAGVYNAGIFSRGPTSSNNGYFFGVRYDSTPANLLTFHIGYGVGYDISSSSVIPLNQWLHVAASRSGTALKLFINGQVAGSVTTSTVPTMSGSDVTVIGRASYDTDSRRYFPGYISNLRVVKNAALYTANFTPSTTALTNSVSAGTVSLLACQSARFADNSGNNLSVTTYNTPRISQYNPFNLVNTGTQGSMYFDGTGDYVNVTNSTIFAFGTGDFTIEAWVYQTATPATTKSIFGTGSPGYAFYITSSNQLNFVFETVIDHASSTAVPVGSWAHLVVCRAASTLRMYINGTQVFSVSSSTSISSINQPLIGNNITGYIADVRVLNRAIYPAAYPEAALTTANNTVLLLNNSVTNAATNNTFLDSSANNFAITRNGNATQGSFSPFSNGGWSNYYTGNQSIYANNAAFAVGTGNFTVELFYNPSAWAGTTQRIFVIGQSGTDGVTIQRGSGSNVVEINISASGVTNVINYTWNPNIGQWYHIALVRSGTGTNQTALYIDGVSVATGTSTASMSSTQLSVGGINWVANYGTQGYISNVRFSSVARVITVPTAPYTSDANTLLLTCQSNRFVDNSPTPKTLTIQNSPSVVAFAPFTPVAYTPVTHGGSIYLDGTGDYLETPATSNLAFGTGPFTIECWVYPTAAGTRRNVVGVTNNIGNSDPGLFLTTTNKAQFGMTTNDVFTGTIDVPANAWSHIAVTYDGTTYRLFVNGALDVTSTVSAYNYSYASVGWQIGKWPYSATGLMTGYISNLRIVKGYALYTAAFTVPTAPVTAVYGTQLLLNATNAGIWDASGRQIIETIGDTKVSTAQGRYNLSSIYFDGTGDVLQLKNTAATAPMAAVGNGNFTVEFWAYPTSVAAQSIIADFRDSGTSGVNFAIVLSTASQIFIYTNTTVITSTAITVNTWNHVAVVKESNVMRVYINGSAGTATYADTNTYVGLANKPVIGGGLDFGQPYTGYLADFRITAGRAVYSTTFVLPTATLPAVERTQLLTLQNNQPHNNHSFQDSGPFNHVITRSGNASQGTFSPFSPGGWSYYFNGSSSLTPSSGSFLAFGTGNYTIEFWIFLTQNVGNNHALAINANNGLVIVIGDGKTSINSYNVGDVVATTTGLAVNVWNHVAIVRSGTGTNQTAIYINGVRAALGTDATNWSVTTNPRIGGNTTSQYMYGYLNNIRVVTSAVYTTNFIPSTSPLQAIAGTTFLSGQLNRFVDLGSTGATFTTTGTPSVSAWSPFAPTASYTPALHGGSAYFDGSGDYLYLNDVDIFNFDTKPFTVECWVYPTASVATGYYYVISKWRSAPNKEIIFGLASNNGTWSYVYTTDGGTDKYITDPTAIVPYCWTHYAVSRTANTISLFRNGVRVATTTETGSLYNTSGYGITIAAHEHDRGSNFPGYVAGLRAVRGTAVYDPTLTTLTVPTAPVTAVANTSLLLNFTADAIEDRSARGVLETVADARHSRAVAKFANTSSMYFDGSGDYLRIPYNPNLWFGSSDWTIELWYYPTSFSTYNVIWEFGYGSPDTIRSIVIYSSLNTGAIRIAQSPDGTTNYDVATGGTAALNTWSHLAFIRNGANITTYINGVSQGTITAYSLYNSTTRSFYIGAQGDLQAVTMFNGYIQDLRVTKGRARYQPAAPTANLSVTASTVLLVPGNTANTVIRDSSVNNFQLTPFGDSRASNFTPYGTGWSNYFDGTSDYLDLPANSAFALGTGDFTIEAWIQTTVTTADAFYRRVYMTDGPTLNAGGNFQITIVPTSGYVNLWDSVLDLIGTVNVCDGLWHHIAAVRAGATLRLFVDGILNGSTTYSTNVSPNAGSPRPRIGSYNTTDGDFSGHISNLRVLKGTAVYTANFVPPTAPLTAVANTSLLTCHANRFADGSTNNFTITRYGDAAVRSFNPFNITNTGTAGSMYFDGSGDYLSAAYNSAFDLGSLDFTLEAWIYTSDSSSNFPSIVGRWQDSGTACWDLRPRSTDRGNFLVFVYTTNGTTAAFVDSNGPALSDNAWHHVVAVRSGNNFALFVDGTRRNTANFSGVTIFNSTSAPLYVGYDPWGTTYFTGYLSNVRVVKGTAVYDPTQTTLTVSTAPLTATANTQLLTLQYRQPHNNHGFQDSSSNQFLITRNGNATQGTFSPFSPSGWSAYFNGSSNIVGPTDTALGFGSNDFTIEMWANIPSTSGTGFFASVWETVGGSDGNSSWLIRLNNNGTLITHLMQGAGTYNTLTSGQLPTNTWFHIAFTRSGNTQYLFINGSLAQSSAVSGAMNTAIRALRIGTQSGGNALTGYISNLRIINGTCLYASNFVLPTSALSNVPNTKLLTCQSNRVVDNSGNNFSLTPTSVQMIAFSPFTPAVYNPAVHGGSAYFDGSDYLDIPIPNSSAFDIVGAFSLECWFYYTTSSPGNSAIIGKGGGSAGWGATNGNQWGLLTDSGSLYWMVNNGSGGNWSISTTTPASFAWHHVAISYNGTTTRVWLNGSSIGTNTSSYGLPTTRNMLRVGVLALTTPGYYHTGYISGLHFVQGRDLYNVNNTSITITTTPPTVITNTAFMLNFTDAAIQDLDAANVLETVADAREVNFGPLMSNYSVYFDGTGDYLTVPYSSAFDLSSGNWTMEAWFNANSFASAMIIIGKDTSGVNYDWSVAITSSTSIALYTQRTAVNLTVTVPAMSVGVWYHVAYVRNGSTNTIYLNGVAYGSNTMTISNESLTTPTIGCISYNNPGGFMNGYISDLRLVKGTAVYTANFTPPTAPLTAIAGTSLLTCQGNRFRDFSTNNLAFTRYGDVRITSFNRFGEQTANPPSISFDGTGDYIKLQSTPTLNIGTANFTIEAWVYPTSSTAGQHLYTLSADSYSSNSDWGIGLDIGSLGISAFIYNGNTGYSISASNVLTLNAWNHIAWTRSNGTGYAYVNGVQVGTASQNVAPNYNASWSAKIGYAVSNYPRNLYGYVADLKVTVGQVLYGGFEPPTQPFATR